ncbi:MAG: stage sporulation protein [Clostridia bacterium]|jgi:stage V sporulation protein G|nr:SpoVG family protein [Clostridiales bacterium]MDK2985227.1 stage sporulation protein [Clostridia bacterium]
MDAEYDNILIFDWLKKGGEGVNITDVRIRKINQEGKMRAIVSVTLDDSFVIHDVKVIEGQNGLFVAMPSRKTPSGEYRDIAHPICSDAREIIQNAVLKAYEEVV